MGYWNNGDRINMQGLYKKGHVPYYWNDTKILRTARGCPAGW